MKKLILILLLLNYSCNSKAKKGDKIEANNKEEIFDDSKYVLDSSYAYGDARRYGVTAETAGNSHPTSGKNIMTTVLDMAEESGIEISFPKGYYKMDLVLNSRKNLSLKFNNSEFSSINIIQAKKEDEIPENITLKGTLIAYARLGITEARNISIDTVYLKTDISKNLYKMRNTGCHIYHGSENIKIGYLEIDDLGSGDEKYKYTHAAIAIDGWNNNPSDITIDKAYIKSTDRHGVYMTGTDNVIKELIIDKFGVGSTEFMDGMQDAQKGEEKELTAIWLNKCYYCGIDKVTINEKDSKAKYTAFFDAGDINRPSEVRELIILNDNPKLDIKKDDNTGVQLMQTVKK